MTVASSAELFARAEKIPRERLLGPFKTVRGTPRFTTSATDAWLRHADNNKYIDPIGSWGLMIIGHSLREVLAAVTKAQPTRDFPSAPPRPVRSNWPRRSPSRLTLSIRCASCP